MLKAIIFDLFETLVTHFDPDWKPPMFSVAERLGISEEDYNRQWSQLEDDWDRGRFNGYSDCLLALCEAVGLTPDNSVIAELDQERSIRIVRPFARIESEILDMVRELKSQGLRLALVTNVNETDLQPWSGCPLAPFFESVIPSFQLGVLKPDPQMYEMGLKSLDARSDEAIFIGDGGWNELYGATQAGMDSFWATWFLDRWPTGIRPGKFIGDKWRQFPGGNAPFPRLCSPCDLLNRVANRQSI